MFWDSFRDLIDSLESKIQLWYLDDRNLSDDYRTVLKDSKKTAQAEKVLGLKIKPTRCECFSLVTALKIDDRHFQHLSKKSKHQRKMNLLFLFHRSARNRRQKYWKRKVMKRNMLMELLKNWMLIMVFYVEKMLPSAKVVVLFENKYMF